jgi:hypothetical protein
LLAASDDRIRKVHVVGSLWSCAEKEKKNSYL